MVSELLALWNFVHNITFKYKQVNDKVCVYEQPHVTVRILHGKV